MAVSYLALSIQDELCICCEIKQSVMSHISILETNHRAYTGTESIYQHQIMMARNQCYISCDYVWDVSYTHTNALWSWRYTSFNFKLTCKQTRIYHNYPIFGRNTPAQIQCHAYMNRKTLIRLSKPKLLIASWPLSCCWTKASCRKRYQMRVIYLLLVYLAAIIDVSLTA